MCKLCSPCTGWGARARGINSNLTLRYLQRTYLYTGTVHTVINTLNINNRHVVFICYITGIRRLLYKSKRKNNEKDKDDLITDHLRSTRSSTTDGSMGS